MAADNSSVYWTTSSICDDVNGSCLTVNQSANKTENPFILVWYFQLVYSVVFVSMVVVAAGGNIIVIWIVLAHKRMRTVTNYFLVNLAVADVMNSLLNTLFNYVYMLFSDWPFGLVYCKFTQFISPCNISTSVFTFLAIALDRYIAIVQPMKPRMKARLVLAIICLIWVVSVVLSSPHLLYAETYTYPYSDPPRTVCYMEWPDGASKMTDFVYSLVFLITTYFLPLVALAFTYARVGRQLWGSQTIGERTPGQEETIRSKRRVVKMMIVVVFIFGVCWLPQNVFFIVTNRHVEITNHTYIQHVYLVIYWLAMSNSMYNPIIYCWMNARFRNGFKYVFRWLPWIKWRSCDVLGIRGTTKGRISLTEGTKYTFTFSERNGSKVIGLRMHPVMEPNDPVTCVDHLHDDNTSTSTKRSSSSRTSSTLILGLDPAPPVTSAASSVHPAARHKHRDYSNNHRRNTSNAATDAEVIKL